VHVERHDTESSSWEIARRPAHPALRPLLHAAPEGWAQTRGRASQLREVPFPGVPLILNLGEPWDVGDDPADGAPRERHDSFVAGLHTRPAFVRGADGFACIEIRFTPLGLHRLLGMPMDDLANRTVALGELIPAADELSARLHDAPTWEERLDLVEAFLLRRLADSIPPLPAVEWSWAHLRRTGGDTSIAALADEVGWSHRRLISRFREQVGVAPKTFARVVRFDRAVSALRASSRSLGEVALDCGYFDQAHMNRDFRDLAGTTPTSFVAATQESGGVAA